MTIVVDSGSVIVAGGGATFDNVLSKDGATYVLTGKTVVATIRAESDPSSVIDATLEDIAVTLGGTVAAALGGVQFTLTTAQTTLLAPGATLPALSLLNYLLQYKVVTDSYFPQLLRFAVRKKLD